MTDLYSDAIAEKDKKIAELRAMLKRLEWKGKDGSGYAACPSCGGYGEPHYRHSPTCALAALLKEDA